MYKLLVQMKEKKEVYILSVGQLMSLHSAGVWHHVTYVREGGASTLSKAVNERFQ